MNKMNSIWPKISIITPSFNQGQYIEQTIQSIINQNYPNLEYIIIDGGSTDNTVEIIKKYESYISYWVSEKDEGQTDAINKGLEKSTGDIINWLNSDDYLAPNALHNIAASFKNAKIKCITTLVRNFDENGNEWDELTQQQPSNILYLTRTFNNQPGTFFRRSVWEAYCPLPNQLRYMMDQFLWFCFWLKNNEQYILVENYTTVFFRRHSTSKTVSSYSEIIYNCSGISFFNEHHLIYWSYFHETDLQKAIILSEYFFNSFNYNEKKVSFPKNVFDRNIKNEIFSNYLFVLIKEDYRLGKWKRLRKNLKFVDPTSLDEADKLVLENLNNSSRFSTVIKLYRNTYWLIARFYKKRFYKVIEKIRRG